MQKTCGGERWEWLFFFFFPSVIGSPVSQPGGLNDAWWIEWATLSAWTESSQSTESSLWYFQVQVRHGNTVKTSGHLHAALCSTLIGCWYSLSMNEKQFNKREKKKFKKKYYQSLTPNVRLQLSFWPGGWTGEVQQRAKDHVRPEDAKHCHWLIVIATTSEN